MSFQPTLAEVMPRSWLLLVHQLPPEPAYFRVKIWRQLQALGAVALKNSVYVLPSRDDTREDFQWLLRAIIAGGRGAAPSGRSPARRPRRPRPSRPTRVAPGSRARASMSTASPAPG